MPQEKANHCCDTLVLVNMALLLGTVYSLLREISIFMGLVITGTIVYQDLYRPMKAPSPPASPSVYPSSPRDQA
jgi:Na+-transporting NADH:ubiquinone oxidoreductase subunit NqrD